MKDFEGIIKKIESAKALFVDWDGCIFQSHRVIPGAERFLRHYKKKTYILSNNSTDLPDAFTALLKPAGVSFPADRIVLAGHQAVLYAVAKHRRDRVFMIANKAMRDFAKAQQLTLVGKNADVVLLLRDLEFNYTKIRVAANMVRDGARLIAANPDMTHPTDDGVVPETGALLSSIQACLGDCEDDATIIGKPSKLLFETALERAKVAPEDVVMLGDNPSTDIEGATTLGMQSVLIAPKARVTLGSLIDFAQASRGSRLTIAAAE